MMIIKKSRKPWVEEGQERVLFSTMCVSTGSVMVVSVPNRVAQRYLDLHKLLPDDLKSWPESELEELVEELDGGDVDCWERTLILLAHHQSSAAMKLIKELGPTIPGELICFGELAFAESLGWLGYSYIRENPKDRPYIHHVEETY